MAGTKLIPYTVRVHPPGETDEEDYWNLTDIEADPNIQTTIGNSSTAVALTDIDEFGDLFEEFCVKYESEYKDFDNNSQLSNTTLALSPDWERNERVIEGNLYLGNSGVIRSILDLESGEREVRGRDLDDSEERPLYFLLYSSPRHPTKAYLILERSSRYGAKGPFQTALREWVQDNYVEQSPNTKTKPVKTSEIFPAVQETDRTVRLRFEKEGHPSRMDSRFDSVFGNDDMKEAIEFRPESGDDMELITDELKEWYDESDSAFKEINGVEYDNVKITIEKNGSENTISLTKGQMKMRKELDLSEITDEGDLPALPEISSRAHSFLRTVTGYDTGTSSSFK